MRKLITFCLFLVALLTSSLLSAQYSFNFGLAFQGSVVSMGSDAHSSVRPAPLLRLGMDYESRRGRITGFRMRYINRYYPIVYTSYSLGGGPTDYEYHISQKVLMISLRRQLLQNKKTGNTAFAMEVFYAQTTQANMNWASIYYHRTSSLYEYERSNIQSSFYAQVGLMGSLCHKFKQQENHRFFMEFNLGIPLYKFELKKESNPNFKDLIFFGIDVGIELHFGKHIREKDI